MSKIVTLYNEEGDEIEVTLPTHYEVCGTCGGKGTSSAYLGAFTREDFDQDPDFMEDYMAGRYDRACDECGGKRVVEVVDLDRMKPKLRKLYEAHVEENIRYAQMERMERMMGA